MDIKDALNMADKVSTDEGYVIDLFPEIIYHDRFFELEDYFLETYLQEFAEKISRISIKLIHYYDAVIYLTEFPEGSPKTEYSRMTYQDLRNLPLKKLAEIIRFVVTQGKTTLGIFLPTPFSLIEIRGGDEFSVSAYGFQQVEGKKNLLKMLVEQEGLFLRSIISDNN